MIRKHFATLALVLLVAAGALLLPIAAVGASGGLSPKQLGDAGWFCFNAPPLGVHCAAPGQEWLPTGPTLQLLYFFNTTDPASAVPDFTGTETLIREDLFREGRPCPTTPSGEYNRLQLGPLGYYACHRR